MPTTEVSILSWNIRQGGGSRVDGILEAIRVDGSPILVLSEFRNNDRGLAIRSTLLKRGYGYQVVSAAQGPENSVLIASRFPCGSALFPTADPVYANSIVRADLPVCRLYGVYLPHKKKHRLFDFLLEDELDDEEPAIITGDFNSGKNGIDQAGDSFWYSDKLTALEKRGYFDAFREIHEDSRVYSWFSHQGNGYRYDHTYLHAALKPILKDCFYIHEWRKEGLSDHSAMKVVLGL
ncbi:MAG: endonuclease/exonuclease/phosphatase family protein [Planctomycetaceae bacterium]